MLKYLLLPVLLTLSLACGPVDEEAEANKRFVEAVALLEAAESEPAAPAKLSLLEQAETTLQTIIARYPSTELAVKLTSGQQIGNVSLTTVEAAVKDARGPACQAAPTSACVIAQALVLVQTLEWGQDSAQAHITRALIDIALAQAQAGDRVGAQAAIAQALALVQTFDKTDRAMALPDIALAQARVGDRTGAQATIAQALALAQTLPDEEGRPLTDEGGRATLLATVALAQAQAGDRAGAQATIAQASAFVQTLPDKPSHSVGLRRSGASPEWESCRSTRDHFPSASAHRGARPGTPRRGRARRSISLLRISMATGQGGRHSAGVGARPDVHP